ncbi:hypothetical protein AB0F72_15795 [Actinoplanes sp. NPDC023936]|uniref:hypothetical protein n=1 Tax=Actinoplanes sp. NPDC023936 TaxID=3154910 RepID=UPI0034119CCA
MRKLWCAGAFIGGILLFGAAPAQASVARTDGQPLNPADEALQVPPLVSDPLSGEPLIRLAVDDKRIVRLQRGGEGAGRTEEKAGRALPAADVVSGTLPSKDQKRRTPGTLGRLPNPAPAALAAHDLAVAKGSLGTLVAAGKPLFTTLGPSGLPVTHHMPTADHGAAVPAAAVHAESAAMQAGSASTDAPLVGLGNTVPVRGVQRQVSDLSKDISGLPLGGSPVQSQSGRSARPGAASSTSSTPSTPSTAASALPVDPAASSPAPAAAQPAPAQSSSAQPTPAGSSPAHTSPAHTSPAQSSAAQSSAAQHSSPSAYSSVAPRDKIDDPRLLEEPTEGLN